MIKGCVSILIPSRNERFLEKTIKDILAKATGDIEVIVVLEGYWPINLKDEDTHEMIEDKRVIYIHREPRGLRDAVNTAAAIAKGEFLMKSDAHCMYAPGFDDVLKKDMEANWIVIARRNRLDPVNWAFNETGKPPIDYEYVTSPGRPGEWGDLRGAKWNQRTVERMDKPEYLIDETPTAQGSMWFMYRDYFYKLELMDKEGYGIHFNEAQEWGLKAWLSGGRVMVNKKTWYAHLHKGKVFGRGYFIDNRDLIRGNNNIKKWLTNEAWPGKQTLPLSWLIERFWPMPTWNDEALQGIKKYDSVIPKNP
jgi:glycosyltransferase involved in cell wall biosynthesis